MPPNVVQYFHQISGKSPHEYFCTSDPIGQKLGSGGGTTWLLEAAAQAENCANELFSLWLSKEKRILLHAGGQSRRLPAYAACGKIQLPLPVFRWACGQKIDQTLLDLQLPLYERIMQAAPTALRTLIASGDVYIRSTESLQSIPEADVVCYGLWVDASLAKNHGVFFMEREKPEQLDFMLQKPSVETLAQLSQSHLSLMDIGIWLLSDKAVNLLRQRSYDTKGQRKAYDLYAEFGCALGLHPTAEDQELATLKVAILPLPGGEFYHFGTTPEMISSTMALQNVVKDQRLILQNKVRQQPSVFTQNAQVDLQFEKHNHHIWVENAHLPHTWTLHAQHVITGVPRNQASITLTTGQCVDVQAYGKGQYVLRPYGFDDAFRGEVTQASTQYLGQPITEWLAKHALTSDDLVHAHDLQAAQLFPICDNKDELFALMEWMLSENPSQELSTLWRSKARLSADEIASYVNLAAQEAQRCEFRKANLQYMAKNYRKSVFYQVNLKDMAEKFVAHDLPLPTALDPNEANLMQQIRDQMFRSQVAQLKGESENHEAHAFALLQEGLILPALQTRPLPQLDVCSDQIVWGRSAVRIDLAGGWTDTPPYCLNTGGNVVNLAIELNEQQPLQVYIKPSKELKIICRSIDLGAMEVVESFEELAAFNKVGSPFSIPKAALALCGFLPQFAQEKHKDLRSALAAFGSGIEITLLSAIPAGSGLGTSSILAATVLGALSNFCGLGWDKSMICNRTLILEQLLTTGGGWQDQYGGVLHGVKLLQTNSGFDQTPITRWLPDHIFTDADHQACHLLYYTGITRTAKHILAEIVRGMFLNNSTHLDLLDEMKEHALKMFDTLQRNDLHSYGQLLRKTWQQNKALDAGTEPTAIAQLCSSIDDLSLGYKLPGAGGGGYLYIVAKDPEAALRIKQILRDQSLSTTARFVDMTLSKKGLEVSRS